MLAVAVENVNRKIPVALASQLHPEMGEMSGVLQLNDEGVSMPAFTFEKLSPPRRGSGAPIAKKQRGLVVAILERFVEARVKREEKRAAEGAKPKA